MRRWGGDTVTIEVSPQSFLQFVGYYTECGGEEKTMMAGTPIQVAKGTTLYFNIGCNLSSRYGQSLQINGNMLESGVCVPYTFNEDSLIHAGQIDCQQGD